MKRVLIAALAAVLLVSACGKETPVPQTVTVSLESNPTTGYSWQAAQTEELFKIDKTYSEKEHSGTNAQYPMNRG